MLVSAGTLEYALFQIFRRHRVGPGGVMAFAELQQDWNNTGLRLADLRDALRALVDKGCLECPPGSPDLSFRLTDAGHRHFWSAESLATEADRLTLAEAQARLVQPPSGGALARRAADRKTRLN